MSESRTEIEKSVVAEQQQSPQDTGDGTMKKTPFVAAISLALIGVGIYLWYGSDLRLGMQLEELETRKKTGAAAIITRALDHEHGGFRMKAASFLHRRSGFKLIRDQPSFLTIVQKLFAMAEDDDLQLRLAAMAAIYHSRRFAKDEAVPDDREMTEIKNRLQRLEEAFSGKMLLSGLADPEKLNDLLVLYILDIAKRINYRDRQDKDLVHVLIQVAGDHRDSVQSGLSPPGTHPRKHWAPALLVALESDNPHQREFAAKMLEGQYEDEFEIYRDPIIESLQARLDDPEPRARIHSAVALAQWNQASGIKCVLDSFKIHWQGMIEASDQVEQIYNQIRKLPGIVIRQWVDENIVYSSIDGSYDKKAYQILQEKEKRLKKEFGYHCHLVLRCFRGLMATHGDLDREIEKTLRDCLERISERLEEKTKYTLIEHLAFFPDGFRSVGLRILQTLEYFMSHETIRFLKILLRKRGSGQLRKEIAETLAPALEKPNLEFEEALMNILKDKEFSPGWCKTELARVLADFTERKNPEFEAVLIEMLTDPNCYQDYSMDYRIARCMHPVFVPSRKPDSLPIPPWGPSENVIRALGKVGGVKAKQHLAGLTEGNMPPTVVQTALGALSQLKDSESEPDADN